ncbi:MAG: LiaF-related protein, partial [Dehalococcoidia bacterium]|nr:LiaF-related protein [Dehalococcoidia bacterium]
PWGVWGTLWRFWPVLIILIGVNIIWGRSHPWLVTGLTLLSIVVVLGIGIAMSAMQGGTLTTNTSISEPRGDLSRVEVEIDFGAGNLALDSLVNNRGNLVEGDAEHTGWGRDGGIVKEIERRSGVGILKLSQESATWFFSGGDRSDTWHIHLSPDIPMELTLKTGASDSEIDLSKLKVTKLNIQTGMSQLSLTLPEAAGRTTIAAIKAGAADVKITVPQNVAARIIAQTGLSSTNIDEKRFPRTGAYYQSPNYEDATNRVDLQVEGGVANLRIR